MSERFWLGGKEALRLDQNPQVSNQMTEMPLVSVILLASAAFTSCFVLSQAHCLMVNSRSINPGTRLRLQSDAPMSVSSALSGVPVLVSDRKWLENYCVLVPTPPL